MKKRAVFSRIRILPAAALFALAVAGFTACDDIGIYYAVAVQEKIEDGSLPDELSVRPVQFVDYGGNTYYFAAGTDLWARTENETIGGIPGNPTTPWHKIGLPPIPGSDVGIQSIAKAEPFGGGPVVIYLVVYSFDAPGIGYQTTLYRLDNFGMNDDGSITTAPVWTVIDTGQQTPLGASSGYFYTTISLRGIDDGVNTHLYLNYVNQYYQNTQNTAFRGSVLYRNATASTGSPILSLPDRYVTGITYNAENSTYWLSAIEGLQANNSGIVISSISANFTGPTFHDYAGADNVDYADGSNWGISVRSITFAPDLSDATGAGNQGVLFLASMRRDSEGVYPVYYTVDDGTTWQNLDGTSADYQFSSFFDATGTNAAESVPIVLGGTTAFVNGSRWFGSSGYYEIDVSGATDAWTVKTDRQSFNYALSTNYLPSNLAESSITGFTFDPSQDWLFATTWSYGTWRLDTSTVDPQWGLD